MARITAEDCLEKVTNRFSLVMVAAQRAKQLLSGSKPRVGEVRNNKQIVTSLREIASGTVRIMTEEEVRLEDERIALELAEKKRKDAIKAEAAKLAAATASEKSKDLDALFENSGDDSSDDGEGETPSKSESVTSSTDDSASQTL